MLLGPVECIADPPDHGIHEEQKQQQESEIVIDLYGGVNDPYDEPGNDHHHGKGRENINGFFHHKARKDRYHNHFFLLNRIRQ